MRVHLQPRPLSLAPGTGTTHSRARRPRPQTGSWRPGKENRSSTKKSQSDIKGGNAETGPHCLFRAARGSAFLVTERQGEAEPGRLSCRDEPYASLPLTLGLHCPCPSRETRPGLSVELLKLFVITMIHI